MWKELMVATQTKQKKTKKETKPKPLNVGFVWDMSGSMGSIWETTKEGTNGYLVDLVAEEKRLIEEHGEDVYTRFSLTAFDTVFEEWLDNVPILDIDIPAVIEKYIPRGGTALYDAIAHTVTKLDTSSAGRKGEKFLVVVMTDGQENSSREYGPPNGKDRIFKLVQRYEKKGNWTFVYLGANVDAYAEAKSMGIAVGNTISYSATKGSASRTSDVITEMTSTLRASARASSDLLVSESGNESDLRDDDDPGKLWTPEKKKR